MVREGESIDRETTRNVDRLEPRNLGEEPTTTLEKRSRRNLKPAVQSPEKGRGRRRQKPAVHRRRRCDARIKSQLYTSRGPLYTGGDPSEEDCDGTQRKQDALTLDTISKLSESFFVFDKREREIESRD